MDTVETINMENIIHNEISIKNTNTSDKETKLNMDNKDDDLKTVVVNKVESNKTKPKLEYVVMAQRGKGQRYSRGGQRDDDFDDEDYGDADGSNRNGFVRLVLSLVFVMLVVTAIADMFILKNVFLTRFLLAYGKYLSFGACFALIALSFVLACDFARQLPCNIIFLILSVIMATVLVACVTVGQELDVILYAVIITAIIVLICTIIAYTSFDFTKFTIYIVVVGAILFVVSLFYAVGATFLNIHFTPLKIVILLAGSLFSSICIILELQLILGGKALELDENDYVIGAVVLYLSIIELFLNLVQLLSHLW